MRNVFSSVLLIAIVAGGFGYWYHETQSACRVPIAYDIGTIDTRFDISTEEVRSAVSGAESLWEDATGKNLFTYTPGADLLVNFIFDERQHETIAEQSFRDVLDRKEGLSEDIRSEYDSFLSEYESLKETYESRSAEYEADLLEHNSEVEYWNEQGGAPPEEFQNLNRRQAQLAREHQALNRITFELNQLVDKINAIGQKGNELVEDYNESVDSYNERFGESKEFTQGDYQGDSINIYQYDNDTELLLVLVHEMGHALGLEHVEDEKSIMYSVMEGQLADPELSAADLGEFNRVCGID